MLPYVNNYFKGNFHRKAGESIMKRHILFSINIISILIFAAMCAVIIYRTGERTREVDAIVTDTAFESFKTIVVPVRDKATGEIRITEKVVKEMFLVTISYKDLSITVKDKELFNTVKVGDHIKVTLVEKYGDDHQLISRNIELLK